jgi:hypothetical protein
MTGKKFIDNFFMNCVYRFRISIWLWDRNTTFAQFCNSRPRRRHSSPSTCYATGIRLDRKKGFAEGTAER